MKDILQLYSMDIYTAALFVVAVVSLIANGIFAHSLRTRNKELDDAVWRYDDKVDECEQLTESVDKWKAQYIHSENSKLDMYYRNDKGQIVPVTPKELKPHTLKDGMTVKDPTPKQAERIFREAKKAGIETVNDHMFPELCPHVWLSYQGRLSSCVWGGESLHIPITATEFVKRIKGEVA